REEDRGILRANGADGATFETGGRPRRARGRRGAERAEEHVPERTVHGFRHEPREDRSGSANERAGDDEQLVAQREPGHRHGETGVRVQERDHDGHIRAADRHDERDAEDKREQRDDHDQEHRLDREGSRDRTSEQHEREERGRAGDASGHQLLARVAEGLWRDQPLELPERDGASREGDRTDDQGQQSSQRGPELEDAGVTLACELEDRHKRGRPTAGSVEERDHLGHRGHLHHPRAREAGDTADRDAREDDRNAALHVRREEGRDDRDEHSGRRDAVALNGRRRRREALQAEDEGDSRDQVRDRDEGLDRHSRFRTGRCLNIASMRSVTTKPPTTFAVPSTTARNPRTVPIGPPIALATSIAPTITIPWIAFAPLMSGVWSVDGTFETTSKPTKIARMKTYAATIASVVMSRLWGSEGAEPLDREDLLRLL